MRAYAVNRTSEGWEMRVLLLPRDVVEQYTAKQVADVLPIVIAKVATISRVIPALRSTLPAECCFNTSSGTRGSWKIPM